MKISVSIIIPAYNVEKHIERCVKSAMRQTLKSIEIIVVNDGSIDGTLGVINELARRDSRIIVVNKLNGGLSSARNTGIKIANGEFIHHLDGDDWIEKDAMEKQYKFAKEHKLDMVVSDFYCDDDNGNCKTIVDDIGSNFTSGAEHLLKLFSGNSYTCVWNKLIKKELYKDVFHPEWLSIGEDLATLPKLLHKSIRIGKFNSPFVHYIFNPHSLTNSGMRVRGYEAIFACNEIKSYLENHGDFNLYESSYRVIFRQKLLHYFQSDKEKIISNVELNKIVLEHFRCSSIFVFGKDGGWSFRLICILLTLFPSELMLKLLVSMINEFRCNKGIS